MVAPFAELLDDFFFREDEPPLDGLQLPDAAAALQVAPTESVREYLAFYLDEECYGVPLTAVREIVRVPILTEVPRGEPDLLGVMNMRGEVLPIYDLKLRLRLRAAPAAIAGPEAALSQLPKSARILVIRGGEAGDVGLLADRVTEVVRMRDSEIEPPPSGTAERECIRGLGKTRDQLCILLDLDRAIA